MESETTGVTGRQNPAIAVEFPGRRRRIPLPSLRLRASERLLLLGLMDVLLLNGALLAALVLWTEFVVSVEVLLALWKWFVTLTVVWFLCALFFDCYNLARAASTLHSLRSSGGAALATALVYTFVPSLTPPLQSRGVVFIFGALAAGSVMAWRVIYAQLFVQPWFKQRALVVGAGHAGRALAAALETTSAEANPFRGTGYQLIGFVDDDPDYAGSAVEGVSVLGGGELLVSLAQALEVDEVVLAITHRHAINDDLFDALLRCRELGLHLTTMSALYERLLGRVPVEHVGRDLHMVVPMDDTAEERFYRAAKRLFDLISALVGMTTVGMLIPFVALANALTSPGPLFYRQQRVGMGGRCFEMFKFRSMRPGAEAEGNAVWAAEKDPRVTPIGRWLRRTRLDELPQFVNVLRGEMSLIGPRPERPEFVDELARTIPFYRLRHAVRPGITGWAQVQYSYGDSVEDARTKLEYDLYYVKCAGWFLDLRILLRTVPVMLQCGGY
ncbi:MAG: sugar transferase [Chloroflexi bacterium]|nr:sugar transferase [Chloroflexota bacterium]